MVIRIDERNLTRRQWVRVRKALRILKSIGIRPQLLIGGEKPAWMEINYE